MSEKKRYRSAEWYNSKTHKRDTFVHRGWMRNQGHPSHLFDGRPVIGICNTWSELTPCNGHFREIADSVKKGVYEAGGFPLEFPVFSASESNLRPTAMLFRNLASMDVEEAIRGNPIDGVVLLMGCDKTTPSLLMGAASVDIPTIGEDTVRLIKENDYEGMYLEKDSCLIIDKEKTIDLADQYKVFISTCNKID